MSNSSPDTSGSTKTVAATLLRPDNEFMVSLAEIDADEDPKEANDLLDRACVVITDLANQVVALQQPSEPSGDGWICVTDRLPTKDELQAGVLFGIHWPEGRVEIVSWDMEYQHDYDLMCRHFDTFKPGRSSGTGYWRHMMPLAPPRSALTKGEKP